MVSEGLYKVWYIFEIWKRTNVFLYQYQVRSCTYNSFSNQCWSRLTDYKHIQLKTLSILMLKIHIFLLYCIYPDLEGTSTQYSASGYILHALFLDLSSQISVYFDLVIIQMNFWYTDLRCLLQFVTNRNPIIMQIISTTKDF